MVNKKIHELEKIQRIAERYIILTVKCSRLSSSTVGEAAQQ